MYEVRIFLQALLCQLKLLDYLDLLTKGYKCVAREENRLVKLVGSRNKVMCCKISAAMLTI